MSFKKQRKKQPSALRMTVSLFRYMMSPQSNHAPWSKLHASARLRMSYSRWGHVPTLTCGVEVGFKQAEVGFVLSTSWGISLATWIWGNAFFFGVVLFFLLLNRLSAKPNTPTAFWAIQTQVIMCSWKRWQKNQQIKSLQHLNRLRGFSLIKSVCFRPKASGREQENLSLSSKNRFR